MTASLHVVPVSDPIFASGKGQYHSDGGQSPRPLQQTSLANIVAMMSSPQTNTDKSDALWIIPSNLPTRAKAAQLADGVFWALWGDLDGGITPPPLTADIAGIVSEALNGAEVMAWSTASATKENQKARLLIPLATPVNGGEYQRLAKALNNKLANLGVVPDRKTESANQIMYLPNKGKFYTTSCAGSGRMSVSVLADEVALIVAAEEAQAEADRLSRIRSDEKLAARLATGTASPIKAFNECYDVAEMWRHYGAKQVGTRYLSPLSTSGVAGVTIKDGTSWVSSHGSDVSAGIGKGDGTSCSGDAFDLFKFFEHGNDHSKALIAAGNATGVNQANQDAFRAQKAAQRPKTAEPISQDFDGANSQQAAFVSDTEPTKADAVDLFGNLALPPFPVAVLPDAVAAYAGDQAELIGVDPAVIGIAALGALAGCIDDRIKIQPKRYDPTWTESARIWVAPIGDPSAKKSPGIAKALAPVNAIAARKRKAYNAAHEQWQQDCETTRQADKKAPLPTAPAQDRMTVGDVTVEKLGEILSQMPPRGIIVHRDELNGWLSSMDAYKSGGGGKDRSAWLEAYNGGSQEIDRIGRGSTWVENWSATIIGGIQPSVIQAYANASNHDGMLQRFVLVFAQPASRGVDRRPDMQAKAAYSALIEALSELPAPAGDDAVVRLSDSAHEVRERFNEKLHKAIHSVPNKFLSAALAKWEGLFARMLLVYHCAECVTAGKVPTDTQVSQESAERVEVLLWRVLLPHSIKFYSGLDSAEDTARKIAALILARSWERFTVKRDLDRYMRETRSMKPWELEQTLDRLEAYNWIRPEPGKVNEKGKPSAYLVNTGVHERFAQHAEQERERRAAVVELMKEIGQ